MFILYRYIIRETLSIFAATCLILITIIVSFRLTSLLNSVVAGDISLAAVWQITALQSIRFFFILMPLSLILAFAISMGRLYSEQELPAALACGISEKHVRRAILTASIPVACIVALGNLFVLPEVYQRQSQLRDQAKQDAAILLLRDNEFRRLDDGTVIFTNQTQKNHLGSFFLYREHNGEQSVVVAKEGRFDNDSRGKYLELSTGMRGSWTTGFPSTKSQLSIFADGKLRLPDNRTHSSNRLRNLPINQLPASAQGYAEWQNRLNPALALILFSALLPLLTRTKPRSSRYHKLMPIFVLFSLYLNGLNALTTAIKNNQMPPWPGSLWIHSALLASIFILGWRRHQRGVS